MITFASAAVPPSSQCSPSLYVGNPFLSTALAAAEVGGRRCRGAALAEVDIASNPPGADFDSSSPAAAEEATSSPAVGSTPAAAVGAAERGLEPRGLDVSVGALMSGSHSLVVSPRSRVREGINVRSC